MRRGGCWTTRNEKKFSRPRHLFKQSLTCERKASLNGQSPQCLARPTVCARHAQEWNGPPDCVFHIQIKLFSKPRSRLQCAMPDCATFIQLDRCSGNSKCYNMRWGQRQRFANATIDITSTHMSKRIIISKQPELAACITTVFVSNLMLLPSALAHGRFNLKLFSASFQIAQRIHTFFIAFIYTLRNFF